MPAGPVPTTRARRPLPSFPGSRRGEAGASPPFKAAETTLAAGRTHFVIVGKEGRGARGLTSPAAFGGGVEQSNYGLLAAGRRGPSEDLMIRLLPANASAEDRAEALEASRLVANIGPRVKKPEP